MQNSYQNMYLLGTTSQNNDSRHDFIEYLRPSSTQKTIFFLRFIANVRVKKHMIITTNTFNVPP